MTKIYRPLISADDHILEPPDVWQKRLPAHLKEIGPKVVETDKGQAWQFAGELRRITGLSAMAGQVAEKVTTKGVRYEEILPGSYDPKARLQTWMRMGCTYRSCSTTLPDSVAPPLWNWPRRTWSLDWPASCVQRLAGD